MRGASRFTDDKIEKKKRVKRLEEYLFFGVKLNPYKENDKANVVPAAAIAAKTSANTTDSRAGTPVSCSIHPHDKTPLP